MGVFYTAQYGTLTFYIFYDILTTVLLKLRRLLMKIKNNYLVIKIQGNELHIIALVVLTFVAIFIVFFSLQSHTATAKEIREITKETAQHLTDGRGVVHHINTYGERVITLTDTHHGNLAKRLSAEYNPDCDCFVRIFYPRSSDGSYSLSRLSDTTCIYSTPTSSKTMPCANLPSFVKDTEVLLRTLMFRPLLNETILTPSV